MHSTVEHYVFVVNGKKDAASSDVLSSPEWGYLDCHIFFVTKRTATIIYDRRLAKLFYFPTPVMFG